MKHTDIERIRSRFELRAVSSRIAFPSVAVAMAVAAACLGASAATRAQTGEPSVTTDASAFLPDATIVELMDAIVMPSAEALWNAVSVAVTANGTEESVPETDEEWERLRRSAIALAEAANSLVIPGRPVDAPEAVPEAPDSELGPEEIAALIESRHSAWVGYAHVLHQTALDSLHAVEAHDVDALLEVGGSIDAACEGCHLQFWYPESTE